MGLYRGLCGESHGYFLFILHRSPDMKGLGTASVGCGRETGVCDGVLAGGANSVSLSEEF